MARQLAEVDLVRAHAVQIPRAFSFARDNVQRAPCNQRNYLTLATAYADAGRWGEAERTLKDAIPLRPDYYLPYDNLGAALFQQGKLAESLYYYMRASELAPGYPNAIYNAGLVFVKIGNARLAHAMAERLRGIDTRLAEQLDEAAGGR